MLNCPKCKSPLNKVKAIRRRYGQESQTTQAFVDEYSRMKTVYEHGECACGQVVMFVTETSTETGVETVTVA
jgi:uncharacterized protein YbaR (Trm112 family)